MSPILLFTELHRVSTAPYAVSLKPLLEILQALPTPPAISVLTLWSASNPCLLPRFISSLLLSLEYCPFASTALTHLATAAPIRDAIFKSKRTFLDGMLKSALSSDRHFTRYTPIILSLLTHPLPPAALPPPANLSTFFLRLVQTATTSPTPQGIKDVYVVLRATAAAPLKGFLSRENYAMLISVLRGFLRRERQGCVLGGLAGLAVFHAQRWGDGEKEGGGGAKDAWGGEGASEFFREKKSERVLSLVCLNVVNALASTAEKERDKDKDKEKEKDVLGEELTWEERLEQVEYAKVIVDVVSAECRLKYLEGDGKKGRVLENLVGKMKRLVGGLAQGGAQNVDDVMKGRLVRAVIEFILTLVGGPEERMAMAMAMAMRIEGKDKGNMMNVGGLVEFVEGLLVGGVEEWLVGGEILGVMFAANPRSTYLPTLLKSCFNAVSSPLPLTSTSFTILTELTSLIKSLTSRVHTSPNLCSSLLSILNSDEFKALIQSFLDYHPPNPSPKHDCASPSSTSSTTPLTSCPFSLTTHQRNLTTALTTLLLICNIHPPANPHPPVLPPKLTTSLLTHLTTLPPPPPCPTELTPPTYPPTALAFLETTATPGTTLTSRDWRTKLTAELSRDASRTHEAIISAMGSVCRDLEARCTDVEAPLREAKARAEELQREVDGGRAREKDLADTISILRTELGEVEHEKDELEVQLDAAVEKVKDVDKELGWTRRALSEERRLREDDVARTKRELERKEEEWLDELAERGARTEGLEGRVEELERMLGEVVAQREKLLHNKDEEINHLASANIQLRTDAESREQDVQGLEEQLTALTAENTKLEQEIARLKNKHEQEILGMKGELVRSREEWGVEREKLLGKVRRWERRCDGWKGALRRKEGELEEVRGGMGRLMGMMEVGNGVEGEAIPDDDFEGDIISDSSESFLQELHPRKKPRMSLPDTA